MVAGTLRVCKRKVEGSAVGMTKDMCEKAVSPVLQLDGDIPRFGAIFSTSFSSPAFASGSFSVTFDEQGPASLKRTNAAARDAVNAVGSVAEQVIASHWRFSHVRHG